LIARLRQFPGSGAASELDLDGTIRGTAEKGYLDIRLRAERHNAVKLLMFFRYRRLDGTITSRKSKSCFPQPAPNSSISNTTTSTIALYEGVWKDNARRYTNKIDTWQVLHTYRRTTKSSSFGDAS